MRLMSYIGVCMLLTGLAVWLVYRVYKFVGENPDSRAGALLAFGILVIFFILSATSFYGLSVVWGNV